MADLDDILNNPEGQTYHLDPGRITAEVVNALETIQAYNIVILKNQIRILQHLKTGSINEGEATESVRKIMADLEEDIRQSYLETMAAIASAAR